MSETNSLSMISEGESFTVMAEFTPKKRNEQNYQSEAELEDFFIEQLRGQAYERLKIRSEDELILNLRRCLEALNKYSFSDSEWNQFFKDEIANKTYGIAEKAKIIQQEHIRNLVRDDGTVKNILLINKDDIHENHLQVINQYSTVTESVKNQYDVTILVNGLPLVHLELKRRGVPIKEAFNQINRYQRDSFWSNSGLFEYVQIFVISNGTNTKYYSNTTRFQHIGNATGVSTKKAGKTSNSFEFTSYWADANNTVIADLVDFTETFLSKRTILNVLTKYCVLTVDNDLLVMRPYQIVATERILNRITLSTNYKTYGTIDGGGYIWHAPGSGKTLTSFKTAQLASNLPFVDKVIFVVDRKDLDYQTMIEYDRFSKGSANSNVSTSVLKKQLEDGNSRIIVTTIQKLDRFVKKNEGHPVFNKHIVLIFDECHRSQFGSMHKSIIKSFKRYHLFGFTGTPIFASNAPTKGISPAKTTEQLFGHRLHTYTIVHAVSDGNVLPFRIEYVKTVGVCDAEDIENTKVSDIDRKAVLNAPERITKIVQYILKHFNQKTLRNEKYSLKNRRLSGFNSMFAVSSIDAAKLYYTEFKKQLADKVGDDKLKIATIFSASTNEAEVDGIVDENPEDTSGLDMTSKEFLKLAIQDYNQTFKTSFDTSSERFQLYYQDVSKRMKEREIDILIVVNMFLTGFDAPTMNALWIDKNLQEHGLFQAFLRTVRILNSIKVCGNIVCFRNLEKAANKAISIFSDENAKGIVLMKTFAEYYSGYVEYDKPVKGYKPSVEELRSKFPIGKMIISEKLKKDFVKLYGTILRLRNILSIFDDFQGKEILSEREIQDYTSMYRDIYDEVKRTNYDGKENINDDVVFEMELVKQVDINVDYMLDLIKKNHLELCKNKEFKFRELSLNTGLTSKRELIEKFIRTLDPNSSVDEEWKKFINDRMFEELDQIIRNERLNSDETRKFMEQAFKNGYLSIRGIQITKIFPAGGRFDNNTIGERNRVVNELTAFFEKFRS